MHIHPIQNKLLGILPKINFKKMSLRDVALLVDETHPQKIRHHLTQLEKKGLVEINKRTGEVKKTNPAIKRKDSIVAVPVYGCADCGEATVLAKENLEGYIRVSHKLIGKVKNIFAVKAQGPSMNRARVNSKLPIEDGDYVLIDPDNRSPKNGEYVLSVIDDAASIKRFFWDKKNSQITLTSESSEDIPPLFIHQDDNYMVNGVVKNVIKTSFVKDWEDMQNAAGRDALKALGPISKAETDYYRNLK